MKHTLRKALCILIFMIALTSFHSNAAAKVIYTGNLDVDIRIEKIIKKNTKEGMTKKQQMKACFVYLVQNMTYSRNRKGKTKIKVTAQDRKEMKQQIKELKAEKNITFSSKFKKDYISARTLRGTCKGEAAMFGMIANHLGFKAGYVTGLFRGSHNVYGHWWSYVIYKGKRYESDVNAAAVKRYKKSGGLKYFMKSGKKWKNTHKASRSI